MLLNGLFFIAKEYIRYKTNIFDCMHNVLKIEKQYYPFMENYTYYTCIHVAYAFLVIVNIEK